VIPTLADTNILLRVVQTTSPHHRIARAALTKLRRSGCEILLVPQILVEFWSVATRPVIANGLGYSPTVADRLIGRFERLFTLLPDNPLIYEEWRKLVLNATIIGRQAHDARLAAAMIVHGIPQILTFNLADFRRFPGITALDPAAVINTP
jgi:predicted nucleic acid-binding protein